MTVENAWTHYVNEMLKVAKINIEDENDEFYACWVKAAFEAGYFKGNRNGYKEAMDAISVREEA